MGLKPDHWIRKMALEQRMIEPFTDKQVRDSVISYGVSSYGYDIRVADEFMIFTNVHSAVVDPKNFDPRSMVEYQGDVCVIPPNSFALARTVEYFRIPRKVLTVCLGKCVTGDTRVIDADTGEYLPVRDFVARRTSSTISIKDWQAEITPVSDHIDNGIQPVFELRTRAGLEIRTTATHPFRTLAGWRELSDLAPGDRIAVARTAEVFGREHWPLHEATLLGLMLSDGQCRTPGFSPRFTNEDPRLVEALSEAARAFGGDVSPAGRHGYDLVNRVGRGGLMVKNRFAAWLEDLGCNVGSGEKFVPPVVFRAKKESVRTFLRALFSGDGSAYSSGDGYYLEYSSVSERLVRDVRHLLLRFGIFALVREKYLPAGNKTYWLQITDRDMICSFEEQIGFIPGSQKQDRLAAMVAELKQAPSLKSNFDTLPPAAWEHMKNEVHARGRSLRSLGVPRTQPDQSLPYATARLAAEAIELPQLEALVDSDVVWDTVMSIVPAGEERVYDLTVPEAHNFLANDIMVHNSTYARCFSADTRVALVDGTSPTLEEMAERADGGEVYWGYSVGPFGRIIVTLLESPRYIGRDALLEIELDNGKVVRCTPDHEIITRDGRLIEADRLRPGDSLMPLDRPVFRGYEMVYQPLNGTLLPTHRLADEWNLRNGVYGDIEGTHRHHRDFDKRNNNPWNIERMNAADHIGLHNDEFYNSDDFDAEAHGRAIRRSFKELAASPEWREKFRAVQRKRAENFWRLARYSRTRDELRLKQEQSWDEARRARQSDRMRRYYENPDHRVQQSERSRSAWAEDDGSRREQQQEIARSIRLRKEITAARVEEALNRAGSIRGAARLLNCDRTVFRRFPDVIANFRAAQSITNHKIVGIRNLPGDHDVYCLTVPEAGNFGLEAGIFVRNCGIIVNVTPFEPEWQGYVTLEISNTTPLPARIYAHEGIAQVLFFEADEECEISYADKKGKYQKQQRIVLPKL